MEAAPQFIENLNGTDRTESYLEKLVLLKHLVVLMTLYQSWKAGFSSGKGDQTLALPPI